MNRGEMSVKRQRKLARERYRTAAVIYHAITRESPAAAVPPLSVSTIDRLLRQRQIAATRGWPGAIRRIERRLLTAVDSFHAEVDQAASFLTLPQASPPSSVRDIAADIAALETDFAGFAVNRRSQTLSVTTEPVELGGVYLGPFVIDLDLRHMGDSSPYRMIAKDPHPAGTSDSTTHPHISDERLCEGDGHAPIRRALDDGRVFDFFVIVRQILNTYNPDSAYISLDDWQGVECQGCGDTVDASHSDCCSRCDDRVCRECGCTCNGCEEVFCDDCTSLCEGCDSCFCSGCLRTCDRCDNPFCDQCLKGDLCDDCLEKTKTEAEEEEPAEAAIHPIRVGETAVPS